ncbi:MULTISPECIES: DNA-binding transcriptional regulator Fis [Ectothiorhodospira]|uniref:DNA-binding transcriptional regulator Fis n=1 Tax=Ectothiorhodospira TaxID=1051 RepID=UPI00024A843E|nr:MULTISPECIES: DNA-binding transcriptional regulator Fis [Ectothiorhodospira]EHQ52225.1 Fis family transcriptional regulator [Ectothiorhodospira sp. PHS-1]MCG5512175.1 DNA-binding transcriptional regulator Fis [Ectothiorhodospira shaposhnikovii]
MTHEIKGESETLAKAVHQALDDYFAHLDGHEPDNVYRLVMEEVERPLLASVLRHCDGNQSRAAQYLGLNRGTLRKKLRQYGLV